MRSDQFSAAGQHNNSRVQPPPLRQACGAMLANGMERITA
jgi:hypothetical protein